MTVRESRKAGQSFTPARSGTNLSLLLVLVSVTLMAYQPAWRGGMLWDDDAHLTAAPLGSWHGLCRIWTDFTAAQQYYPIVNSVFWLMNRLLGA